MFPSGDQQIWKVNPKYWKYNKYADRETFHSVCQLLIITTVDKLNLVYELGRIPCAADLQLLLSTEQGIKGL